jgi:hypothetical protein
MKLRDEFSEFIHERWTQILTRILVPVTVLTAIYSAVINRLDILWVSVYVFVIIFISLNALYILLAREKAPVIPGKEIVTKRVAKFSLLLPYARAGLVVSLLLIPLFGFVSPFNQPITVLRNGTPTYTPTITLTPTQTLTPTETPTSTATSTLTPTATPKAQGVYYMIVLDASANMTKAFDGKTQWDAAHESISAILEGLEPGASYGLVTVGGSPSSQGVDPCGEPSSLKSFFAPRQKVSDQIAQLQPVGGGSLYTAFVLEKNQFEGLPENTVRILIYITGSSDACKSQDEWQALDGLLSKQDDPSGKFYSEIIVLDENVEPAVQSILTKINDRSTDVDVQLPRNFTVLQQAYPTIVNNLNTYIKNTIANYPTATPIPSQTLTPTLRPVTPTLTPTITVTPSITPTFGAPTTVLTWTPTITPVTPSATAVPATSVKLLSVTYLTQGVGCQIDVQVSVDGGPATGTFHVRNDSFSPGDSTAYPQTTLQVGTNYASSFGFGNLLTLSGDKPIYYTHEIWFDYNGIQSNHLTNLFCPGIPPP